MKATNIFAAILFVLFLGCSESTEKKGLVFTEQGREVPEFSEDSAYAFIQKQVDFGPRIPNTESHAAAKKYLLNKLREYAGKENVFAQNFTYPGYGDTLQLTNLIAAFNTSSADRVLLCAHWDTRAMADEDSVDTQKPFSGADDGGSGVGVILELARLFSEQQPPVGVDIVLFDGEDYGKSGDLQKYFLGSRYWSENPPVPGYNPRFGILLDMVGAENAIFYKEKYSLAYAPNLVHEIWNIADEKGYGSLFPDEEGASVLDDHYIINQQAHIPMVDIINHRKGGDRSSIFPPHWHTQGDNMDIISKTVLKATGQTVAELLYNRIK